MPPDIPLLRPNAHDEPLPVRLLLIYLLFIVYGSLLPFNWNDLGLATAWENFRHIPFLRLGVESRADWVANLVLYIPLGFMTCGWLTGPDRRPLALAGGAGLSLLFSAAVALGVEFSQQFFPPRTVSLNDILAEITGAALGIALWPVAGMRLMHLARSLFQGGANARHAALVAYALAYAALSLFPFDFLLSHAEWQAHLASGNVGWLFAPASGSNGAWKLIAETLAAIPLGMLGVLAFGTSRRVPLLLAALVGMLLGALVEGLQLTIASGISQGASIGSRAAGIVLGVWLLQSAHGVDWHWARRQARGGVLLCTPPYLVLLMRLNHWFPGRWTGLSEGLGRLADLHFMPFYYHYYTAEAVALVSLLFQAGLYLPIGAGFWLWHWAGRPNQPEPPGAWPAIAAGVLASVIETGKLFIPGRHPDPTNVLIAAAAAMMAYRLLHLLVTPAPTPPAAPARQRYGPKWRPSWTGATGAAALCIATAAAATSPIGTAWVLPPLLAYMILLWRRPDLWLVWTLALLPLLDLTPWSGRLYWTEYDTLLLATIGMGYLRAGPHSQAAPRLRRTARLLLVAFGLSAALSLVVGLLPLGALDQNAFSSYTSPYNALRVAKGLFFAIAFIPLLTREWAEPDRAARRLAFGMTLGLAAEVLYVLWERVTFSGLLNFETGYRITGSFPGMHVGGAYIEGYLVTALPFVALWAWQQRRIGTTLLAAGLYGLGAYSVMVTFSRGGQVAFALATLVVVAGFTRLALRTHARRLASVGTVILVAALALAVALPIFSGKYSQSRLATIRQDLATRTDHWADALHILRMRNASTFGVGLGTFPSAYFWGSNASSRPATYAFVTEDGNTFLRLGSGETVYFEQPVAVVPEQEYTLAMDLRANTRKAALTVPVCEKGLLYSFTCAWTTLKVDTPPGQWRHYETRIQTRKFGPPRSLFPRPVKLSIFNGQAGSLVDVDNVALRDRSGKDLVRNGDFSDGMHRWFFSTDSHLAWHAKNLYLHVLFEQGWVGLIVFLSLIVYAAARWLSRAWSGDPLSLALCASLAAFLVVGMVDSLIDETRLGFLLYLLLIAGLVADGRHRSKRHRPMTTSDQPTGVAQRRPKS